MCKSVPYFFSPSWILDLSFSLLACFHGLTQSPTRFLPGNRSSCLIQVGLEGALGQVLLFLHGLAFLDLHLLGQALLVQPLVYLAASAAATRIVLASTLRPETRLESTLFVHLLTDSCSFGAPALPCGTIVQTVMERLWRGGGVGLTATLCIDLWLEGSFSVFNFLLLLLQRSCSIGCRVSLGIQSQESRLTAVSRLAGNVGTLGP
mmetsp:Transcript_3052/g.4347  ORF Transcript_3052/g.4347 Transcript_3052/m.4347 type:complete len:206 (-) Transcript_3052:486-1103(-)